MTRRGAPKTIYLTTEAERAIAVLQERWGLDSRSATIVKALTTAASRAK